MEDNVEVKEPKAKKAKAVKEAGVEDTGELGLKVFGIEEGGLSGKLTSVPLDDLPKNIGPPPSLSLLKSVKSLGVVTPVILAVDGSGKYTIADGIRRVLAARASGHTKIQARVIEATEMEKALITITSNHHRSENPHAEGKALEALLSKVGDDEESVRAVSKAVAVDFRKAGGILKTYRNLVPAAKIAIRTGKLPSYLAKRFALLSEAGQERLLDGGEVTDASVAGEKRKARKAKKEFAVVTRLRAVARLAEKEGRAGLARTLSDIADEVQADKEKYKAKDVESKAVA